MALILEYAERNLNGFSGNFFNSRKNSFRRVDRLMFAQCNVPHKRLKEALLMTQAF